MQLCEWQKFPGILRGSPIGRLWKILCVTGYNCLLILLEKRHKITCWGCLVTWDKTTCSTQPGMADILQVVFPGSFLGTEFPVWPKKTCQTRYLSQFDQISSPVGPIVGLGISTGCGFHSVELMDEISWLRFEDRLLSVINGHLRNAIIRQYQDFKGESYVPDIVPDTLKWTKSDPINILKVQTDTLWCLI